MISNLQIFSNLQIRGGFCNRLQELQARPLLPRTCPETCHGSRNENCANTLSLRGALGARVSRRPGRNCWP